MEKVKLGVVVTLTMVEGPVRDRPSRAVEGYASA